MPRRIVIVLVLLWGAALAAAVAPWTIVSDPLTAAVARQLRAISGLELSVGGRSVIAFLPVPRLKFEDVRLTNAAGRPLLRASHLRGEFRILPLLVGQVELREVALNEAEIQVDIDESGASTWDGAIARLRARIVGEGPSAPHLQRISLSASRAVVRDRRGPDPVRIDEINGALDWPSLDGALDLAGSGFWRGELVQLRLAGLRPASLLTNATSRFDLQASAPLGRTTIGGEASFSDGLRASGRATFESPSLRDFLRWSGLRLPLGPVVQAVSFESAFTAQPDAIFWPSVKLALGSDRLEGAVSARRESGHLALSGTLAAGDLTLTEAFGAFRQARTPGGLWSADPLDLGDHTGGELDLRLSAATARLGSLRLEDLAANVQVKPGRIEASLGRASVHRGLVKGRLTMAASSPGPGIDLKLVGSFDRVEAGAALAELGLQRAITGTAQGQVALEASGETPAELARHLHGRIASSVRQGELIGIGLAEVLRRVDRRPLSALDWRGGRTPFEQFHLSLAVDQGAAEIVEGQMTAPSLRGLLKGRVSLYERTLAVKAAFDGAPRGTAPAPSITLDISGPWDDINVAPDARALIERSGAAQPLLGPEGRSARTSGQAPAEAGPNPLSP